jgi:hypothetical protein
MPKPLIHVEPPSLRVADTRLILNREGLIRLRDALATADSTDDNVTVSIFENGRWAQLQIIHADHEDVPAMLSRDENLLEAQMA